MMKARVAVHAPMQYETWPLLKCDKTAASAARARNVIKWDIKSIFKSLFNGGEINSISIARSIEMRRIFFRDF